MNEDIDNILKILNAFLTYIYI